MKHQPRKRFGQHFLQDQAVISRIIAAIAPKMSEHLIEIGPGQGALTLPLLRQAKHLEVVELDRDLIPELERRCERAGDLEIYSADALTFDFAGVKRDHRLLRLVGNLPYNISTPLIFHLLTFTDSIADMTFMLQKEVAERLAAHVGSDAYGRLSVMVQYACQVDLLFDVPPSAFFPPPKVESSIVRLVPYRNIPHVAKDTKLFAEIVKQAFSQRRKTLRNTLKLWLKDADWMEIQIDSIKRAEELSVQDFVKIEEYVYLRDR